MKKRTLLVLSTLTAGALAVTTALPASAAVTYPVTKIAVTNQEGVVATDPSTGNLWVGVNVSEDEGEQAYVRVLDGKTHKLIKQFPVWDTEMYGGGIQQILFTPKNHRVWIDVSVAFANGVLKQFDSQTYKLTNDVAIPAVNVAADQTSGTAFYASNSQYSTDPGTAGQVITASRLYRVDGTTGATTSVAVPNQSLADSNYASDYGVAAFVAFNPANFGVYVTGPSYVWAYTTKLRLAHTTPIGPYNTGSGAPLVADSTTNKVYVTASNSSSGGTQILTIDGPTGDFTGVANVGSVGLSPYGRLQIDPSVKTLYLGTKVLSTTTFKQTGTLPYPAESVNTSDHSIDSSVAAPGNGGQGYAVVITRKG